MPRWCPKWCLLWWNVWSSGASSSGSLLPCSVPGVESFWPWWFCSWPLASTTFFHPVRNKLPTKNTQRAAEQKVEKAIPPCCAAMRRVVGRCRSVQNCFLDNSEMGCNQQTGYIQSYRTTIVLLHSTFLGGRSKRPRCVSTLKARTLESPSRKLLHDEVHSFMPQLLKWGWVKTQTY